MERGRVPSPFPTQATKGIAGWGTQIVVDELSEDGGWGGEAGEFLEGAVGEFESCGGDVLFNVGDGRRSGDGKGRFGASEEPGEGDLQGSGIEVVSDTVEDFVGLPILAERSPGNEGDRVLLAEVEKEVPFAVGKAVAVLHGDDGDDFEGALEVFEGDVGERHVLNLALFAEAGEAFHRRVERDSGIGNVKLVDGDAVEAEALETAFDGLFEMLRAGVVSPLGGARALPSALGGDYKTCEVGVEGLSDEFFGDVRAVGVGGVDEVDSQFNGAAEGSDGGGVIVGWSPDAFTGDSHGAVAETVHGEVVECDGSGGCG